MKALKDLTQSELVNFIFNYDGKINIFSDVAYCIGHETPNESVTAIYPYECEACSKLLILGRVVEERQNRINQIEAENKALKELNDLKEIKTRVESELSLIDDPGLNRKK